METFDPLDTPSCRFCANCYSWNKHLNVCVLTKEKMNDWDACINRECKKYKRNTYCWSCVHADTFGQPIKELSWGLQQQNFYCNLHRMEISISHKSCKNYKPKEAET